MVGVDQDGCIVWHYWHRTASVFPLVTQHPLLQSALHKLERQEAAYWMLPQVKLPVRWFSRQSHTHQSENTGFWVEKIIWDLIKQSSSCARGPSCTSTSPVKSCQIDHGSIQIIKDDWANVNWLPDLFLRPLSRNAAHSSLLLIELPTFQNLLLQCHVLLTGWKEFSGGALWL